ncbi:hypothetical protein AB670_00477 [Chryseobacterium sp. MOF25P]|nr:hypothetical protein AB670_00477 [Chryseobacterium sp. MOF25P]OBW45166.1 hypothetical protein AB671_02736 [Chryseobacterium sp. BGARF1]
MLGLLIRFLEINRSGKDHYDNDLAMQSLK